MIVRTQLFTQRLSQYTSALILFVGLSLSLLTFPQMVKADPPAATPPPEEEVVPTPPLNIFEGPSSADFKALNPLEIAKSPYADQFSSPAGIINRALIFIYPLAGLILFVMIVWGGFEMVVGATNKKAMEKARQRITAAIIGFGILFASFWIIQLVEYIFNLAIL
ncbi:hypothetical protein KA012_00100 [Candidatus Woesebacteria bacterium]|nr:hypothetical protein [Candidatus Woesebacteria bacterium]